MHFDHSSPKYDLSFEKSTSYSRKKRFHSLTLNAAQPVFDDIVYAD